MDCSVFSRLFFGSLFSLLAGCAGLALAQSSGTPQTPAARAGAKPAVETRGQGEGTAEAAASRRAGILVKGEGVRMGNRTAVTAFTEVTEDIAASDSAPGCTTIGPQNTAVLMLTMPSNRTFPEGYTAASLRQAFFGSPADASNSQSLNGHWKEMSYGKTSVVGQVFGPFALSQDYTPNGDVIQAAISMTQPAISAADATVDFRQFTRIALVFPAAFGHGWSPAYSQGCWALTSPSKGRFSASVVWLPVYPDSAPDVRFLVRLFGYVLGPQDSVSDEYGAVTLGPLDQPGATTTLDPFSAMGSDMKGHYAAEQKSLILHWLEPDEYQEATSSGGFMLYPLESTANPRGLRVLRDALSSAWLWLEYRQPIGDVDSLLLDFPGSDPFDGALVYYEDPNLKSPASTYLLTMDPVTPYNAFSHYALRPGLSWSDPYSLLTLSVGTPDGGGLPVTVSYDKPCARIQYSATTFPPGGGSGTITVSAPSYCAWSASSASSWIVFTGNTSGFGNGTVPFSVAANWAPNQQTGYIAVQRQSTRIIARGTVWPVASVSPSFGKGATGQFQFALDSLNSYPDIPSLNVSFSGAPACEITAYPSGKVDVKGDPGGRVPRSIFIGTPGGTASNSVCSISSSGSSISGSGNQLLITLQVSFSAAFAGAHRVRAGVGGGPLAAVGTWVVPHAPRQYVSIQADTAGAVPFMLDDGSVHVAPATFAWPVGSQHTVTWLISSAGQPNARYVFQGWTDGGSNPRTITVPSSSVTYTANIRAEYLLSLVSIPAGAGQWTASPPSIDGYYESGTTVQVQVATAPGYSFTHLGGDVLDLRTLASVTMWRPLSVTANFDCVLRSLLLPTDRIGPDSTTWLVEFSTGAGCVWAASSDSAWLTVSPASGRGSSTLRYAAAANPGSERTGQLTLNYNADFTSVSTIAQDAAGSQRPSVISLSPVSGAGSSTVATVQFSAPGGYDRITQATVSYLSADYTAHCEVEFSHSASQGDRLVLSDDHVAPGAGASFPGSGTLSVSRCSLDLSAVSVSGHGSTLTLALPLHFAASFAGHQLVSLRARTDGGESPNQQMGTWTVPTGLAISGLGPWWARPGGPAFTLTVNGTNFASGAEVRWDGAALVTTFVSAAQLAGAVPAGLIASEGAASVTVVNPGGEASAAATFTVSTVPPPVLAAPANGATSTSLSPILTWSASAGATSYDVS
jgi:hypothetical protein